MGSEMCIRDRLGFFGYLFLASFLVPLQPSLENLWFVSFWWPVFSFIAIFITPLIVYWPLKTRLSNLFSYNFDDFFPIFSFLAFFGASLHLISNFFFVYDGWELVGIIFSVLAFIAILATFVHSRKSYSAPVSAIILLLFAFLSVLKAHVLIYMGAIIVLVALREFEKAAFKYLEYAKYHKWTEVVWAKEDIHEWIQVVKQLHSQIQNQKETTNRQTFMISVEPNTPTILFFNKLQQEIDKKNNTVEHRYISLHEKDEDIYNFQRKLFGQSQDIGELIEQGFDEDPIAAQNKIFQSKLSELTTDQDRKGLDLHIYIENYDNLSKRTAEQLEAFLSEQNLSSTPSKIFVVGTKVQRDEHVQSMVPALSWERIKEISSDYISEEIIEWIEKEAKSEAENDSIDFNGTLTLEYLLQKIEYLIWYHNRDIQDTAPGVGDPMDVVQKGLSTNIITKTTSERSKEDYKKVVSAIGEKATSRAILLYEYFDHSTHKGEISISIEHVPSLEKYLSNERNEHLMIPYTSLLYVIKKMLNIRGKCTIKEILSYFSQHTSRAEVREIIQEFRTIRNSTHIQSQLTKIFIESLIDPKAKDMETSFKTIASYYEKFQNQKAMQLMIHLGEYLFPNSDLVLDIEVRKQIVDLGLRDSNRERLRAFNVLFEELSETPSLKIELRTWHEFLTLFVRNSPSLQEEEKQVFDALNEIYAKHLVEPTSLYENSKSNIYYQYQIAYDRILIEKSLPRQAKEEEIEDFISSLEDVLAEIEKKTSSEITEEEKEDLRLVTIHIRNKLFRTMMGSKQSNTDDLIEKTQKLILDREELQKEELDFDYALMRDIYAIKKQDYGLAFTYALKALSVTVSSMSVAIKEQDFVQKDRDVSDVLMTISRLAGLYLSAPNVLHPTIREYLSPDMYSTMINVLFPNQSSDTEKWNTLSPKEFILHCCHAVCNKDSFGAPFFFSKKYQKSYLHQASAYIYLIDPQFPLQIKEKSVISEIKHKLHTEDWKSSWWFTTPQGIIDNYQKDHSESFIEEFDQFIDSKSVLE